MKSILRVLRISFFLSSPIIFIIDVAVKDTKLDATYTTLYVIINLMWALLAIFALLLTLYDSISVDKNKENDVVKEDDDKDTFEPKYMLLRCTLCGTTVCESNHKIYPKYPCDSNHHCKIAESHKTINSQIIKPVVEVVEYSNHTLYNADYIKISDKKYQDKDCKIHDHW